MNRQSWRCDEDQAICKLVSQYGLNDWTKISEKLKQTYSIAKRTGKQCRERWYNHLNPAVNKKPWDNQEETLLFQLHKEHGNKWKDISRFFLGRTDNDIKNHFYSTLRRSLRRLNKISGQKNSTSQMREIKPSVLSTIMNYIYDQEHHIPQNLLLSLQDLPTLIFQYANFKPIKNNLRSHPREDSRGKIYQIFQLINKFNEQYQKNKQIRHQQKKTKRYLNHSNIKQSPQTSSIIPSSSQYAISSLSITITGLNPDQFPEDKNHFNNSQKTIIKQSEQDDNDEEEGQQAVKGQEDGLYESLVTTKKQQQRHLQQQDWLQDNHLLKRNLSLEYQDMEQQGQMPSLIGPQGYIFQVQQQNEGGEVQLDLTIVGHRWQPQNWQIQIQIKQFVDDVLEMNQDLF